jgi:hypothetical protein
MPRHDPIDLTIRSLLQPCRLINFFCTNPMRTTYSLVRLRGWSAIACLLSSSRRGGRTAEVTLDEKPSALLFHGDVAEE